MNQETDFVISCRNVWKVFGPDPKDFCARAFSGDDAGVYEQTGHIAAVRDVSLDISRNEIFVIMGLSGSGKSTLLRCMARLIEPTVGDIFLNGQDLLAATPRQLVDIRRRHMGMVFQNFGLMPHLNVLENVAFPLRTQGVPLEKRNARAAEFIEITGLKGREHSYPDQLSGGQQQRVGIARSLVVKPDVWFLDEPFSALDPLIRTQMQDEFLNLREKLNTAIVFVTHDFLEALKIADRICIMKDGRIVQVGTPSALVLNPADDYVRKFTREVPLAKVLKVGAIQGGIDPVRHDVQINADSNLEEAIRLFGKDIEALDVVNSRGEVTGSLNALQVIRSLDQSTGS